MPADRPPAPPSYPWWIQALFYGGLTGIAATVASVAVAVFEPAMPGTDLLMLPCLAGLAALYIVSVCGANAARRAAQESPDARPD